MKTAIKLIGSLLFIASLLLRTSSAQCIIDSTQTQPGLHPDSLVNARVNQFYSQDVTFVMVTDTLGLSITNYNLASLTGLPLGMQWVCNQSANGCNYNPAQSIYGCVRISGTPLIAGTYPLSVTVVATVFLIGSQSFNFNTTLVVEPALVSNSGFSMTNSSGCAPLTVNFTNNIASADYYKWNFGNGDTSIVENPSAVLYTNPGDYVVTQVSILDTTTKCYLSGIKIDSIPNNGGIFDTPDIYILLKNQAGATVYDSRPSINNATLPAIFSPASLQLNNETYTVFVWDEDTGITAPDDPLGNVSFSGHGNSGTAYATIASVSGRLKLIYTILKIAPIQNLAVDTVHVYPGALAPLISAGGSLTLCDGDTLNLNSNFIGSQQWLRNNILLVGENSQNIAVISSGDYSVVVSNSFGCSDTSSSVTVNVNFLPPYPNFSVTGNVLTALVIGNFQYQWILNDTLINSANGISYTALQSGDYRLQLADTNGCIRKSFPIYILVTGISQAHAEMNLQIIPNPSHVSFTLAVEIGNSASVSVQIKDMLGAIVASDFSKNSSREYKKTFFVQDWARGIYFVEVKTPLFSQTKKIVVN
jgi:PKD repeat protein